MNHSFDIEHARVFGLHEAIMIQNLQFWIEKNRANARHFYDERTWTYNSVKAFSDLFPYFTAAAVRRALASLQEQGVIVSGNYNASQYDRTAWYAFTDEACFLSDLSHLSKTANGVVKNSKWSRQKQQMELSKTANPFDEKDNSHTDVNTDVNTEEVPASPAAPLEGETKGDLAAKEEKPKPPADPALQDACRQTWDAYAAAYGEKYGTPPLRNAKVNTAIKSFVQRIGYDEAPAVATFFVQRVDDSMVLRGMHDTGALLKGAEAYRTQWATGRTAAPANTETAYQRSMRERVAEVAPAIARKAPGTPPPMQAVEFFNTVKPAPALRIESNK